MDNMYKSQIATMTTTFRRSLASQAEACRSDQSALEHKMIEMKSSHEEEIKRLQNRITVLEGSSDGSL